MNSSIASDFCCGKASDQLQVFVCVFVALWGRLLTGGVANPPICPDWQSVRRIHPAPHAVCCVPELMQLGTSSRYYSPSALYKYLMQCL